MDRPSLQHPWTLAHKGAVVIPSFSSPGGVSRFDRFLGSADGLLRSLPPEQILVLCALLYEGLSSYEEFTGFLHALEKPTATSEGIYVHWVGENNRMHARALDPRTHIALSRLPADTKKTLPLQTLQQTIQRQYPTAQRASSQQFWPLVFHDASAWLCHHIPKFCLAMVTGAIEVSPLSKDALIRAHQGRNPEQAAEIMDDDEGLSPAFDSPLETLLDHGESLQRRARCLAEIRDVFSLSGHSSHVRLSDHHWRKTLHSKLAHTADFVAGHGTEGDALILLWVHHLLSVGSLQLKDPSVATIARYISALDKLISEHYARCTCSAAQMDEEQWQEFFSALGGTITSGPQTAALAAFHQFCVQTFGAPPIAPTLFPADMKGGQNHANIIWPSKIDAALGLSASISNDARVRASVEALLALGAVFPLRIGEAQSLRLEDFRVTDDGIELRFHPRRSQHQGKSYSARRLMRSFGHDNWVTCVRSWIERRMREEHGTRGTRALLFGDPHREDQTYMFATCNRLVNRLLKQVSADSSVSFHTLRHAWVNRAIVHGLSASFSSSSPISWLQELSAQVGHADVETTLTHYFHRPDLALRCALNNHWHTRPITAESTAFWSGRKGAALRKAKERIDNKSTFYWSCLVDATKPDLPRREHLPQSRIPPSSSALSLVQVRKILRDLREGLTLEAIASRCSAPTSTINDAIRQSVAVANDLFTLKGLAHRCRPIDKPPHETLIRWLLDAWQALDVQPDVVDEPSSEPLGRTRSSREDLDAVVQAWMRCKEARGVALRAGDSVVPLLRWLHECGISGSCIVLRIPTPDIHDHHARAISLTSDSARHARQQLMLFSDSFSTELVGMRKTRDYPYMLIARTPIADRSIPCASARLRMRRFHGLLFSIAVWLRLPSGDTHA